MSLIETFQQKRRELIVRRQFAAQRGRQQAAHMVDKERLVGWAARNAEGHARMVSELLDPPPPGRLGHFMRLASGNRYWPLDPRPEEVFIDDVARALSKLCRFNGHVAGHQFYSVAEHSVWVSRYVPEEHALEALLHDAAEAYTGDMIRPIKVIPAIAEVFKPIEALNDAVIATRFDLRFPFDPCIKEADEAVCTRELRTIMKGAESGRDEDQAVCSTLLEAPYDLDCLPPYRAEHAFMVRFVELMLLRGLDPTRFMSSFQKD